MVATFHQSLECGLAVGQQLTGLAHVLGGALQGSDALGVGADRLLKGSR